MNPGSKGSMHPATLFRECHRIGWKEGTERRVRLPQGEEGRQPTPLRARTAGGQLRCLKRNVRCRRMQRAETSAEGGSGSERTRWFVEGPRAGITHHMWWQPPNTVGTGGRVDPEQVICRSDAPALGPATTGTGRPAGDSVPGKRKGGGAQSHAGGPAANGLGCREPAWNGSNPGTAPQYPSPSS
jgi:hypothetical protein